MQKLTNGAISINHYKQLFLSLSFHIIIGEWIVQQCTLYDNLHLCTTLSTIIYFPFHFFLFCPMYIVYNPKQQNCCNQTSFFTISFLLCLSQPIPHFFSLRCFFFSSFFSRFLPPFLFATEQFHHSISTPWLPFKILFPIF